MATGNSIFIKLGSERRANAALWWFLQRWVLRASATDHRPVRGGSALLNFRRSCEILDASKGRKEPHLVVAPQRASTASSSLSGQRFNDLRWFLPLARPESPRG